MTPNPKTPPVGAECPEGEREIELIARAIQKIPSLGVYGVGNPAGGFGTERIHDVQFHRQVGLCADWIGRQEIIKSVTQYHSYGYKHIVERESGEYIPNGAFIAAAVGLGLKYRIYGPNASFNISKRARNRKA